MHTFLIVLHVIVALFLVLIVLLQTGKGAAMGSAFGSGASQTMFGSSGAGDLLSKLTTAAAVVFMLTSLSLAAVSSREEVESVIPETAETVPVEKGESEKPE